jgi:hypothetical protein
MANPPVNLQKSEVRRPVPAEQPKLGQILGIGRACRETDLERRTFFPPFGFFNRRTQIERRGGEPLPPYNYEIDKPDSTPDTMWESLEVELDRYVDAKESCNWETVYKTCGRISSYYRDRGNVDKSDDFLMEGVIFELQGGQDYGSMDEMDRDLFGQFDSGFASLVNNSLAPLVMDGYTLTEIKEIYDRTWTKIRIDGFPRSKQETWEDIENEIRRINSRSEKLLLKNRNEYEYPISIKYGYPTSNLLNDEYTTKRKEWIEHIERFSKTGFGHWIYDSFDIKDISNELIEYDKEHGIFGQSYLSKGLWGRVKNESNREDLSSINDLVSKSNIEYPIHLHKKEPPYKLILEYLYYTLFIENIDDIENICSDWVEKHKSYSECEICGNEFRVIDIPHFVYFGSDGLKKCCFRCPIIERPDREEMKDRIKEFVEACGFIPNSNFGPSVYSFNSRLSDEEKIDVLKKYGEMGGRIHIDNEFDSWFKALDESGALPEGYRYSGTGVWCFAKDGHKCHSLAEQQIDNWLTKNGIDHTREPDYPSHEDYNPSGDRRADWKTEGEVFIEYFGMVGNQSYDEKTEEKIALADEYGIDLLPIYPKDLEDLDSRLGRLLD